MIDSAHLPLLVPLLLPTAYALMWAVEARSPARSYAPVPGWQRLGVAFFVLTAMVGSLVPYFTPSVETKLWIVIAATTLFFFFRTNKYSFSTFFITIQALTSFSLAGLDVYAAMPLRIIDTLIGAAIVASPEGRLSSKNSTRSNSWPRNRS